jgi:hypothetical protein
MKGWVIEEIQKGGKNVIRALKGWVQRSCKREVNHELSDALKKLDAAQLEDALKGLHQKKQWI